MTAGTKVERRGRPVERTDEQKRLTRDWRQVERKKKERAALAKLKRKGIDPAPVPSAKKIETLCRQVVAGFDAFATAEAGHYFDADAARDVVKFFHTDLSHVKGKRARQAFVLEDWQIWVFGNLFGWKHADTGYRRFREALIYVPRKNGKTPMAAGAVDYLLFEDGEPGAEIYGAAAKYSQASLLFHHARGMVRQNERLDDRCKIFKGQQKAIQLNDHEDNVDDISTYVVISADHSEGHGYNTHAAVIDELHLQPDRQLVDQMLTSTAAEDRTQPMVVYITTADFERPGSICNEKHDYACKVRDGIIEAPSFLPVIFEASKDDDWTDEAVWRKANPNLGVSVSLDYLRKECERAKESPAYENTFKRLHLNIRTEQDVRWLPMEKWDACGGVIDLDELRGVPCYAGLDLASTQDVIALVLLFVVEEEYLFVPYFFVPEEQVAKRSRKDRIPYDVWVKQGFIETTPGDTADYAAVRRRINEIGEEFLISEMAIDRLFQGHDLACGLADDGFDTYAFGQGFASMAAPTQRFETLVLNQDMRHGGHPVLRWMASNVTVEIDAAGCQKPSKKKSTEKIDGIVSAIMALGRAMQGEGESVYANNKPMFV